MSKEYKYGIMELYLIDWVDDYFGVLKGAKTISRGGNIGFYF